MNGFACNYPPHFTMETDIKYLRAEVERLNSEYNRYIKNSDEIINNAGDKIQELAAENNRLKAELALHQNSNKANSPIVSDRQILRINELEAEIERLRAELAQVTTVLEQNVTAFNVEHNRAEDHMTELARLNDALSLHEEKDRIANANMVQAVHHIQDLEGQLAEAKAEIHKLTRSRPVVYKISDTELHTELKQKEAEIKQLRDGLRKLEWIKRTNEPLI